MLETILRDAARIAIELICPSSGRRLVLREFVSGGLLSSVRDFQELDDRVAPIEACASRWGVSRTSADDWKTETMTCGGTRYIEPDLHIVFRKAKYAVLARMPSAFLETARMSSAEIDEFYSRKLAAAVQKFPRIELRRIAEKKVWQTFVDGDDCGFTAEDWAPEEMLGLVNEDLPPESGESWFESVLTPNLVILERRPVDVVCPECNGKKKIQGLIEEWPCLACAPRG